MNFCSEFAIPDVWNDVFAHRFAIPDVRNAIFGIGNAIPDDIRPVRKVKTFDVDKGLKPFVKTRLSNKVNCKKRIVDFVFSVL